MISRNPLLPPAAARCWPLCLRNVSWLRLHGALPQISDTAPRLLINSTPRRGERASSAQPLPVFPPLQNVYIELVLVCNRKAQQLRVYFTGFVPLILTIISVRPHRKPRINSQLVAQQVAQQYAIPPPPKKEKKEKPERPEKDRAEGERPDRNPHDGENTDKDKSEKEQPEKEKKDREKEITPAITKKPNSKKNKPKSDSHQSPPSERNSIQSGKSTTKTKNSHISRPKLKNIDRSTAQQLAITVGNVTVIITDFKEKTRTSSTSSSTVTSSAGSEQQHQSSGSESMDKGSSRASTPKGDLSVGHDESF
ncbi:RING1 and YY1-binding protein B [Labeo rohita]|uniref:RING1 and YY1-binding protein B n=1 Tax=Labeo rohita TaxID=84645 RepID=A0ABQ8MLQ5_LABRO|nr:RING1 and YY1-binding protein B [Labeo rohita]